MMVTVGSNVPNFEMETYEPASRDFGKVSLAKLMKAKKWTILVPRRTSLSSAQRNWQIWRKNMTR